MARALESCRDEPGAAGRAGIRTGTAASVLPEEIITVRGRWISIKELPSGDIAIKAVRYDPDVVALVRTVARQHFGRYRSTYFSWVIPRFRADAARAQLRAIAAGV